MTLIIAEAGVNHNGNEDLAFQLVEAAAAAGADIVKFQTFKAKKLVTAQAKQAEYQIHNTQKVETQLAMLSRLELSYDAHHRLMKHCDDCCIEFLSTAFDFESLEFLTKELKLKRLKIPSGEVTNAPLVLAHARTGCDLILSTGMCNLSEIEQALAVIAFGYTAPVDAPPSLLAFEQAYASVEGQKALQQKVIVLHCTTEYPAPVNEINLSAMQTMASAFHLKAGYSDHSEGITIPVAAVAMGAVLIEKHFTLDKTMEGPDHKASLEPDELRQMVRAIRDVGQAIGQGVKFATGSEVKNKAVARKVMVAVTEIQQGETFTTDNIQPMRSTGAGASPYRYWELLERSASRSYLPGEAILD